MIDERYRSRIAGLAVSASAHVVLAVLLTIGGPLLDESRIPPQSTSPAADAVYSTRPTAARSRSVSTSREQAPPPRGSAVSGALSSSLQRIRTTAAVTNVPDTGARAWIDHLWQSTVFAALAGLLTLAFRRNRAHVRYWLWFSASMKFLVPFALLMTIGSQLPWAPAAARAVERSFPAAVPAITGTTENAPPSLLSIPSVPDTTTWRGRAIVGAWALGFSAIVFVRLAMWRRMRAILAAGTNVDARGIDAPPGLRVCSAPGVLEPGVVGFIRPVLLVPRGIETQLTPDQLQAVLAHEFCHVRRRDNFTALMHMAVEAVFWFHPLVWWIGARLVDERERACDEEVVAAGHAPGVYAESILRVCKLYVQPPLACVTAVTGADLRKRIETIMRNSSAERLGRWRKLLLATAAVSAVVVPIAIGALNAPRVQAQGTASTAPAAPRSGELPSFEAAAIKQNRSGDQGWRLEPQPGGRLTGTNVPADALIRFAYDLPDFQIVGGPAWLRSDRFDVVAKAEGDPSVVQKRLMLRRLLEEKIGLKTHVEPRPLPIYTLLMARSDRRLGPRLRRTSVDCSASDQPSMDVGFRLPAPEGPPRCGYFGFSPETNMPAGIGGHAFRGMTMPAFAKTLVMMVRRNVIDRTGLDGYYDADWDFVLEVPPPPPPPGLPNPFTTPFTSIFTVLPEQLGLKLESGRGTVDVLVIDGASTLPPE